ncbi:flagellar protein FlaG [Alkaliphilus crotonatoxidans]
MKLDGVQAINPQTSQVNGPGQGSREQGLRTFGLKEPLSGEKQISQEELNKALDKANKSFQAFDRKLEVSIHEKTNTIMVKVIDSTNDQVIREIPPEKILDMAAHMLEVAGIIIDKKI